MDNQITITKKIKKNKIEITNKKGKENKEKKKHIIMKFKNQMKKIYFNDFQKICKQNGILDNTIIADKFNKLIEIDDIVSIEDIICINIDFNSIEKNVDNIDNNSTENNIDNIDNSTEKNIDNIDIDNSIDISIDNTIENDKKRNLINKKNVTSQNWLVEKANMLWSYSDENHDGFIDYQEFKKNICSQYKGLNILPEPIKKMIYSEMAGEDGQISKKEFQNGFFKICKNYLNVLTSKKGKNIEIFNNKGLSFKTKKNSNLTIGVGICLSFVTGMVIMHKIKN